MLNVTQKSDLSCHTIYLEITHFAIFYDLFCDFDPISSGEGDGTQEPG